MISPIALASWKGIEIIVYMAFSNIQIISNTFLIVFNT